MWLAAISLAPSGPWALKRIAAPVMPAPARVASARTRGLFMWSGCQLRSAKHRGTAISSPGLRSAAARQSECPISKAFVCRSNSDRLRATRSSQALSRHCTTSTLTRAKPVPVMPRISAARRETSMTRPLENGPRSLIRTTTCLPVLRTVTRTSSRRARSDARQ